MTIRETRTVTWFNWVDSLLTTPCAFLFVGGVAKSVQFPFHRSFEMNQLYKQIIRVLT